jgi:L-threonylcarbamoyladenylate synthase
MVSILKINEDDFEDALDATIAHLAGGGVIIYPTDTVYGIGCDANSRSALENIRRMKKIEPAKPFSVMMADRDMISEYCEIGPWAEPILDKYLPGPYTFLLKDKGLCAAAGNGKLGVRIPDSAFCQALSSRFGRPIVSTSANISGKEPPADFRDIEKRIIEAVGIAIDAGPTRYAGASAIVDLVDKRLIREGGGEIDMDALLSSEGSEESV